MKKMVFQKNTPMEETNAQQETKIYSNAVYAKQYHLCEYNPCQNIWDKL